MIIDEVKVGLERDLYQVNEDMAFVTVCAIIIDPIEECSIEFSFEIKFSLLNNSAGMNVICCHLYALTLHGLCVCGM